MKKILGSLLAISTLNVFANNLLIPMGTIIIAKIQTGAILTSATSSDPTPVMAKLVFNKENDLLPDRSEYINQSAKIFKSSLSQTDVPICKVSGSAFLDKQSLLAHVRVNQITCQLSDGKYYTAKVQGYFADYNSQTAGIKLDDSKFVLSSIYALVVITNDFNLKENS